LPVMPIGACIVAHASERAGHTVRLLDLMFSRDARDAIKSALTGFQPDVVGLSIRNIDNVDIQGPVFFLNDLQGLVQAIRARTRAPIVLGGAALGVMPEEILRLVPGTFAVIGDGEMLFPQVLDRISRTERFTDLPGVACIENGIYRRNSALSSGFSAACQAPDYVRWLDTAVYRSQMATAPIQTKTGCQFQCVYCTYPKIEGNSCCLKEPGSVAEAVVRLAQAGLRDIELVDSVFNAPLEHAMAVCAALSRVKHKARLQCLELNPRDFDDALVSAMERAGFAGMGITLESASDAVLQGLRKGFTSRDVHHAAQVVRRHGIPCAWIFMFGGPGETPETVRETLQFAGNYIRPHDVAFFTTGIRIYPGTELEAIAREQGVLSDNPDGMLAPVFYVAPQVEIGFIERELKKSMDDHMNFISIGSLGLPFLPTINRFASTIGLHPPHWRHTRIIRRALRLVGMDV
jgi:radical SAM superfamily enzyme YgiQ (UPF0313 family)